MNETAKINRVHEISERIHQISEEINSLRGSHTAAQSSEYTGLINEKNATLRSLAAAGVTFRWNKDAGDSDVILDGRTIIKYASEWNTGN